MGPKCVWVSSIFFEKKGWLGQGQTKAKKRKRAGGTKVLPAIRTNSLSNFRSKRGCPWNAPLLGYFSKFPLGTSFPSPCCQIGKSKLLVARHLASLPSQLYLFATSTLPNHKVHGAIWLFCQVAKWIVQLFSRSAQKIRLPQIWIFIGWLGFPPHSPPLPSLSFFWPHGSMMLHRSTLNEAIPEFFFTGCPLPCPCLFFCFLSLFSLGLDCCL
jgi:hypothetical protein